MKLTHNQQLSILASLSMVLAITSFGTGYSVGWAERAKIDLAPHVIMPVLLNTSEDKPEAEPIKAENTAEELPMPTDMELLGTDLLMPEPIHTLPKNKNKKV